MLFYPVWEAFCPSPPRARVRTSAPLLILPPVVQRDPHRTPTSSLCFSASSVGWLSASHTAPLARSVLGAAARKHSGSCAIRPCTRGPPLPGLGSHCGPVTGEPIFPRLKPWAQPIRRENHVKTKPR